MKSEKITIAKIDRDKTVIQEIGAVLRHPAFAIVAAFVVVEALQKVYIQAHPRTVTLPDGRSFTIEGEREPLVGTIVGTMLEGALVATPMIQAAGSAVSNVVGALNPAKALTAGAAQ